MKLYSRIETTGPFWEGRTQMVSRRCVVWSGGGMSSAELCAVRAATDDSSGWTVVDRGQIY